MKIKFLLALFFISLCTTAQVNVTGQPTQVTQYRGGLWANGLLITPVQNQINSFPTIDSIGRLRTDITSKKLKHHNGSVWTTIASEEYVNNHSVPFQEAFNITYNGTAGNTATLSFTPIYTPVVAYINGQSLNPFSDYTISGRIITINPASVGLLNGVNNLLTLIYYKNQ